MFRRTLIAVVAILAITGTTATAATLITGKQIKNGSVTGADIKNSSLGAGELTRAARASLQGQRGASGLNGAPGAKGDTGAPGAAGAKGDKGDPGTDGAKGDQGDRGPSNAFSTRIPDAHVIDDPTDSREVIGGTLPAGSYVITAKVVIENNAVDEQRAECRLGVMRGLLFDPLDRVDPMIDDEPANEMVLTLQAAATVDGASNRYLVECEPSAAPPYSLRFRDRSLIAIQVATLTD